MARGLELELDLEAQLDLARFGSGALLLKSEQKRTLYVLEANLGCVCGHYF